MIQDEAGVGAAADEVRDLAQLIVRHAEIEGEAPPTDRSDALDERRLQGEPGRLPLDVLANAFDSGRAQQRIQRLLQPRAPGPQPLREIGEGHDGRDAGLHAHQALDELHLFPSFLGQAVALHEYELSDADLFRRGCVVGREEGPIERWHAPEPCIVTLAGVPEVDVGVDYLHRVHAPPLARIRSSATANTMMLPMMISWM